MIVIYEVFDNDGVEDERNIGDFNSLKEAQYFLQTKFDTKTSVQNLSKILKTKGKIKNKYKIFKIK